MADENQYINPIIQAMIASSQLQGQAAQRQQSAQQNQAENQARQRQLDLEQQRIENEHELNSQTIKNATQLLGAHLGQMKAESLKSLADLRASGVDIGSQFPGQPTNNLPQTGNPEIDNNPSLTQQTVSLPGLGINNVPINSFPTQEQSDAHQASLIKAKAFAQTAGEHAAMAPYTTAANAFTQQIRDSENNALYQRTLEQGANEERVANIRNAGSMADTAAKEAGANYRTQLTQGFGTDPDNAAIFDNAEEAVINGTEDMNKLPATVRKHVLAVAASKGDVVPTDTKAYNAALEGAASAQQLLHMARDMANNYSSDSPGASYLGNAIKQHVPGTDLQNAMDSLDAQVNSVRTGLGVSRSSNPETERLMKGLFSPTNTKEQNLAKIESLAQQLNTSVNSQFPKNIPAQQKNRVLSNRQITDFGNFQDSKAPAKPIGATGRTAIQLEDGTLIQDTPQNRQLHGLPLQ